MISSTPADERNGLTLSPGPVAAKARRRDGSRSLGLIVPRIVLDEFDVKWLRLKLSKPGAVRGARAVGVIIERSRD